ncbi:class I SAM-dependent methyltransferase [Favolaschia claudopus]|uniref:Class I SAM-dependent methyltransferase n=1 Tax=Favolaschia claudopus TaxID=2862362 RepID=A0AAW0EI31_9AGAR
MTAQYTHGHHDSVVRSHSWRTAENSCGYFLSCIRPDMHILDVGCGPGTITADLAKRVPQGHVTGIECSAEDVLQTAREQAAAQGLTNLTYSIGDVLSLPFSDASFDVVHAHQVLQHVPDPVLALKEMYRVAKPGGIVVARDTDFSAMTWYPKSSEGISLWHTTHMNVGRKNGGEPDSGRRLLSYALEAGIPRQQITATASTWCYSAAEDVAWWSSTWADRVRLSTFASSALEYGFATEENLEEMSSAWKTWGEQPDAWFALLHGEILCRKC